MSRTRTEAGRLHALSGAYALDALDRTEREAFERHLERCPQCAQDVREFSATAARLGAAVALPAPPGTRDAVLARIDGVRQLPPARRSIAVLRRRALPMALAACLAGVLALGGAALREHQQAQRAADALQAITAVLAAPDARTVTGRSASGATARVVVSASRDRAAFLSSGLPAAPPGRTYQLWLADGTVMRPAGLLDGAGAAVLRAPLGRATAVGLTLEPEGGSPRPTTTPLLLLPLTR
ncbi:anti-sigma factor [Streptomyces sp. NBC_00249]|uniref:anti-sigma factor n=1 Tax=Streptomyces sp. NBC_00249 TaxID=2975690 RepID=UPI0022571F92|nr:anti-sigma factor [Streptomyces sp. NBC_00249]MCX5193274.1 anti-sigma factor [Streptomyces sp. NBC_00249]